MDTLVSAVLRLDDTLRTNLSSLHIDEDTDGALTATLSIAIMIPHGTDTSAGPYAILDSKSSGCRFDSCAARTGVPGHVIVPAPVVAVGPPQ